MKKLLLRFIIAAYCFIAIRANAQEAPEQLNLPGDNLNLYAVMKLFQESPTLEGFEKKLNDQSAKINNLDLNGDNKIDYIKVIDNIDGNIHNIALKVAVTQDQDQDVAVFVVRKEDNGAVDIQLIGDEALYGKDYIIEPNTASSTPTPNPGYTGTTAPGYGESAGATTTADVQIAAWPLITFIYVPTYTVWRSPWHWGYYPSYWQPWRPFYWHEYYGYQYHWDYYYRAHYRYTPVYRIPTWRDRYYSGGFRSQSVFVTARYDRGDYRRTYSRPDLANRGADLFRRDHPRAPSVNRPLPKFDNANNNRPIVNRPSRPAGGDNAGRPAVTRPGRPDPANGNNNNGNGRPVAPNPGNGNVTPGRPIRPANPNPGSAHNNSRPAPRPSDGSALHNRPVIRPVSPNPGNSNHVPSRPVNPSPTNNMPIRPVPRPVTNNNNMPGRPATRPMPTPSPRQPQIRQPQPAPAVRPASPRPERHGNQ